MKTLRVDLPGKEYDIVIKNGLLDHSGEEIRRVCPKARKLFVVTDSNVGPLYGARLKAALEGAGFSAQIVTVLAGESAKCPENLTFLWEAALEFGLTRSDAVVALGGGVVGDLAGFCAATVLRGVNFVQIPTTLLAQVDSSVGGKVAIDLKHGKNLAGCFWQPKLVIMDPEVLKTLENGTFSDGMAEVIKYGCIFDEEFFRFLSRHDSREKITEEIEYVLYTCCDYKRKVVVEDEFDTGARMLLNFGHTLGHAYELLGNYETYTHGQAVAAGMVKAMELGKTLGITEDSAEELKILLDKFRLPTRIDPGCNPHLIHTQSTLCAGFAPLKQENEGLKPGLEGQNAGLEGVKPHWNDETRGLEGEKRGLDTQTRGLDGEQGVSPYAAAIGLDKKGSGEDITLVLLKKIGQGVLHPMKKAALLRLVEED